MRRLPQSTAVTVMFFAVLSADHVSPATGKTLAVTLSKAGAAFGNPAAGATNATEVSSGWYKVALGAGDIDTLGDLVLRAAGTDCDDVGVICHVVDANTGGLAALPAAAAAATGGLQGTTFKNAIADALLDRANGIESGITLRQALRLTCAVLFGKASGFGASIYRFRDPADSKDRVIVTVSTDGRPAVTLDAT